MGSVLVIIGIILFVFAGLLLILGTLQFFQIGPLINLSLNSMSEEELETLDGTPYYRQSGIIFWLVGVILGLQGGYVMFQYNPFFLIIEFVMIGTLFAYGLGSTVKLRKERGKK